MDRLEQPAVSERSKHTNLLALQLLARCPLLSQLWIAIKSLYMLGGLVFAVFGMCFLLNIQ